MKISKSDAYRIYKAGNSLWSLTILHNGNEEAILRDLKVIHTNLAGTLVPTSAPTLEFMKFSIERSKWQQTLL